MRLKSISLLIIGFALGIGIGYVVLAATQTELGSGIFQFSSEPILQSWSPEIGTEATDFVLEDLTGQKIRLSEIQDQVILINFWASWCGPCVVEMPVLQDRFEKFKTELIVLAVNAGEDTETAKQFVTDNNLNFPVLLDSNGMVQKTYRVRGLPTTFIIDKQGIIRVHHIGGLTELQLDRYLDQLGVSQ